MNLGERIRRSVAGEGSILVTAPGRVNLMGDHTDYSLLPVLPMAIDRSITVGAAPTLDRRLAVESEQFPGAIELTAESPVDELTGWHRYVAAAAHSLGDHVFAGDLLIGGDLPSEGGLSSSSALTVAMLATLVRLHGLDLSEDELIERAVFAERTLGLAGGTMDQTIIVKAQASTALRIDFDPPGTTAVTIPEDLAVAVAHSGTTAAKTGGAQDHYNTRVVGCRIAAMLLADMLGVELGATPVLSTVRHASADDVARLPARLAPADLADAGRVLHGTDLSAGTDVPVRASAAHVLSESLRVGEAVEALESRDHERLGDLLDQSHESLRSFGSTTPELDRVVEAMRDAGAYGARVTGAGFGGYAVAVCDPEVVRHVVSAGADIGGGPAFRVVPSTGVK